MARTKVQAKAKAKPRAKPKTQPKAKAKPTAAARPSQPAKPRTFEQVLTPYPPDVQLVATQTRTSLRDLLPDLIETVDGSGPYIGFGYTSGYKGQVCTIIISKGGVKLGLAGGAALADPDGLLEGSGKVHRYVQLKSVDDLQRPGVTALVHAAAARAHRPA
jgi:hypothetical protein